MLKPSSLLSFCTDIVECLLAALIAWFFFAEFLMGIPFAFYIASAAFASVLVIAFGYKVGLLYPSAGNYMGMEALIKLMSLAGCFVILHYSIVALCLNLSFFNAIRGSFVECALVLFIFLVHRFFGKNFLRKKRFQLLGLPRIVIYGAGEAGEQLLRALMYDSSIEVKCFIDDNQSLVGRRIGGKKIYSPESIHKLIDNYALTNLIVAMPSVPTDRIKKICDFMSQFPLKISTLPHLSQLATGMVDASEIKEINLDDLLGREELSRAPHSFSNKINGSVVLVTGAGGSIGSELCRQLLSLNPKKLVLVEISEFALFSIFSDLNKIVGECKKTHIVPLLGDVTDQNLIDKIFSTWNPDIIFHAAAYKHVPIVEENVCAGVRVNIVGTLSVTIAALKNSIKNLVLVSTDKAVNPTNIMGASKRVAEMVIQAACANPKLFLELFSPCSTESNTVLPMINQDNNVLKRAHTPIFSIVRFGNVLGSSGSVVPIFIEQIANGGPVKVTHPDVVRYFMTIPEAAKLVIQANSMAAGGEVFILDMGKPKNILELAKKLIHLSGKKVAGESESGTGVRIEFTGLRPGEKLYEELLLTDKVELTDHPRIFSAKEEFLDPFELLPFIQELKRGMESTDIPKIYRCLIDMIENFSAIENPVDLSWRKSNSSKNLST